MNTSFGGDSSGVQPLSNVATIYSTYTAFAAVGSTLFPTIAPVNPTISPTVHPSVSPSMRPGINVASSDGWTALMCASFNGHLLW